MDERPTPGPASDREIDEALEPLKRLLRYRETLGFEESLEIPFKQHQNKLEVNFMASIDFENLKQKLTDAANTVADKTSAFAKTVAEKSSTVAKDVAGKASGAAKKAKLNAEIAAEREGMKKKYQELGKLYFEKYSSNPDPDFSEPMTAIQEALERVADKQTQIDALEVQPEEPEEPVEPDHVTDEVEDTVEAAADQAAEMAEEAAEEARRTFEETVK